MTGAIMTAGAQPGELLFTIGREVHTTQSPRISALEQMSQLLGGGFLVDLYSRPETLTQEELQKAWQHGFLMKEDPGEDIPTARAYVTAGYVSLVVVDLKTLAHYVTPHVWACNVACGKKRSAKLVQWQKEMIP